MSLYDILEAYTSLAADGRQKMAQNELKAWQEERPAEFLDQVIAVITGDAPWEVDENQRFVAATMLKAFCQEYSRAFPGNTKAQLRERIPQVLFGGSCEMGTARALAIVVARLARDDYPHDWPGLFDDLMASVEDEDYRTRWCALMCIHQVMKHLEAKYVDQTAIFEQACCYLGPKTVEWIEFTAGVHLDGGDEQNLKLLILSGKIAQRCFTRFIDEALLGRLIDVLLKLLNAEDGSEHCVQPIERITKILMKCVQRFATTITDHISDDFFSNLLPELSKMIERFSNPKIGGRAMTIISTLLEFMSSNEGVNRVMCAFFGNTEATEYMISVLIEKYLADDVSREEDWMGDPEEFVEELDVNEDADEADKCAEKLFLSLVEEGGELVCNMAWNVVDRLLHGDNSSDTQITSALRAIGVGYFGLAMGEGAVEKYIDFLGNTLLELLKNPQSLSHWVLRRVVWVIGMWCEHLTDQSHRGAVHNAMSDLLQEVGDAVITLTTLRTIKHFISDNNFDPTDIPQAYAIQIFNSIERMMPALETPGMIRELAELVSVMFTKRVSLPPGVEFGNSILRMFRPVLSSFMNEVDNQNDDGEDDKKCNAFCFVLDTLQHTVHLFERTTDMWTLYGVVQHCANIDNAVHTWTEDHAWDLMGAIARASHDVPDPAHRQIFLEAMEWCINNAERDFDGLPGCINAVAATVLLMSADAGGLEPDALRAAAQLAAQVMQNMSDTAFEAGFALADIICLLDHQVAMQTFFQLACEILCETDDVQTDMRTPAMAAIISRIVRGECGNDAWSQLTDAQRSNLCERMGLTVDIAPSRYCSHLVVASMATLASNGGFPQQDDLDYVGHCVEGERATDEEEDSKVQSGEMEPKSSFRMYLDMIRDDTDGLDFKAHHNRLTQLLDGVSGTLALP